MWQVWQKLTEKTFFIMPLWNDVLQRCHQYLWHFRYLTLSVAIFSMGDRKLSLCVTLFSMALTTAVYGSLPRHDLWQIQTVELQNIHKNLNIYLLSHKIYLFLQCKSHIYNVQWLSKWSKLFLYISTNFSYFSFFKKTKNYKTNKSAWIDRGWSPQVRERLLQWPNS